MTDTRLWNTAVRVVANLEAANGWDAVHRLSRALRQAGFDVVDDGLGTQDVCSQDVSVGAFEAEEGTTETWLPPHRAGYMDYDWRQVTEG